MKIIYENKDLIRLIDVTIEFNDKDAQFTLTLKKSNWSKKELKILKDFLMTQNNKVEDAPAKKIIDLFFKGDKRQLQLGVDRDTLS